MPEDFAEIDIPAFFGSGAGKVADTPMIDPTTLALINAGSNVLGRAVSPSSAPSRADSQSNPVFNSSGWSVEFGPGDSNATAKTSSGLDLYSLAMVAGVALVAIVAWARLAK